MPPGTRMGHLHLHVGDLDEAGSFYSDALGLDRMVWHYPGALFLAAGGYHHHLGTNTWAGRGAAPATEEDARLLEWTVELPDEAGLRRVEESLGRAGHPVELESAQLVTRDPWGTQLRLVVGGGSRAG